MKTPLRSEFRVHAASLLFPSKIKIAYGYDLDTGRVNSLTSINNQTVNYGYQAGTAMVSAESTIAGSQEVHHSLRAIDLLGRSVGLVSGALHHNAHSTMGIVAAVVHHFDGRNRRMDAQREDGSHWQYGYNDRSEVTAAARRFSDNQLVPGQSFSYNYDGMGNRTSSGVNSLSGVATTTYTPDGLNRYSSITTPGITDVLVRSSAPVTSATVDGNSTINGVSPRRLTFSGFMAASIPG